MFGFSEQRTLECSESCIPLCPLLLRDTQISCAIRRDYDISQSFSMRAAMLPLHPLGSCLIGMSTLREGFCHSSNGQEVASHSRCYHEYRLGLNGEPHAAKHCELPFGGEDAQNLTLPGSYCHKDTLVLEGRPYAKKHCKLPARWGGNATQHEIAEMHCNPLAPRLEYLASSTRELRGPHGQRWQPRKKACAA